MIFWLSREKFLKRTLKKQKQKKKGEIGHLFFGSANANGSENYVKKPICATDVLSLPRAES